MDHRLCLIGIAAAVALRYIWNMSETRDAMRSTHGLLPAVLRSQSSILIALDPEAVVLLWNSGAERTFGVKEETILGRAFPRCAIRWDWERIEQLVPGCIAPRDLRLVQPFTRPDGRPGVVAMQVKPQFRPDGGMTGCLWLGSDTGQSSVQLSPPPPTRVRPSEGVRTISEPTAVVPAATQRGTATVTRTQPPDPTRLYPVHYAHLDTHLVATGEDLAQWRILHAMETRLDDRGMEVVFTLSRRFPGHGLITRRILIAGGELVSIQDR